MKEKNYYLAMCQDKPIIYTYRRIYISQVNDSLYKYDIQSTDDGFDPLAIKETVLINHWGSLLSKEPLMVDKTGWYYLKEAQDFLRLSDIPISLNDYLNLSDQELTKLINEINMEVHYADHTLF